jgi:hypothetical protein
MSSDEEAGPQDDKKYVKVVYEKIGCSILIIFCIAVGIFLLFCIGWAIYVSTLWIIVLMMLIGLLEIPIWSMSLTAGENNRKEKWEKGVACQMLWYGGLYPILVLAECAVIGGIGYLIFEEHPQWFQIFAYISLGLVLVICGFIHIVVHWCNIYGQESNCISTQRSNENK